MPYDAATLQTILDRAADNLAAILLSPKPSYNIDGQQISWTEYQEMLQRQISWAKRELADADGPYFRTDQVLQSL